MKNSLLYALIKKDIQLYSKYLWVYFIAGGLSIGILNIPSKTAVIVGFILLITTATVMYSHATICNIVYERRDKNICFVMTLPLDVRTYNLSKIISSSMLFFSFWGSMLIASLLTIHSNSAFSSGTVSFYLLAFGGLIPAFIFLLATSLAIKSESGAVAAMVFSNIALTALIQIAVNHSDYQQAFNKGSIFEVGHTWPTIATHIITGEMVLALLLILFTIFIVLRQKAFF